MSAVFMARLRVFRSLPTRLAGGLAHGIAHGMATTTARTMARMMARMMTRAMTGGAVATALLLAVLPSSPAHAAEDQPAMTRMPSQAGIDAILGANRESKQDEFLDPDQAFRVVAVADGPDRIRVEWAITPGYYIYKSKIGVATTRSDVQLGMPSLPTGDTKTDEYFGTQEVYHEDVVGTVPVARPAGGAMELPVEVTYQGCAEAGLCYPPITKKLRVNLPAGDASTVTAAGKPADGSSGGVGVERSGDGGYVSPQDRIAGVIRDGNLFIMLVTAFALGVGLSFTPCVLPMIPIISGIIVGSGGGQKVTVGRGFSLAFTYVQGMALTYAAAGAIFVTVFKQAPQAFFQKPWIIGLFSLLFVVLALAMFGAFTLQLPSSLQTRLTNVSNQQKSGTYIGTFVMGALSALVVTACVAPVIIGALTVISQSGQIARGAGALYAAGLGMGVPVLLVGASAGSLLPKVGPWMETVKQLFGVLFMAVAIYLSQPLFPAAVGMLLWSALAVIAGYWIFTLKARDGGPAPAAVRAPGLIAVVYGILLLIGVASGGRDPLQPLASLRGGSGAGVVTAASGGEAGGIESELPFETIKSVDDLQARVAAASAAGKTVMLDFYADWCVSCKEMEKYTFTDPAVKAALDNTVLLRADVTKNDALDQALMKHFGIFGPPTIAFYDAKGTEQRNYRVVGYMKAGEFADLLRKAFASEAS
jgi:thiol:disulfide interchange protein DsbD